VVNGSGYVSDATRARIEAAVIELQYRPNAGARMMRSGESRVVGVLVPALDVHFFGILAHTVEQALFARGTVVVATSNTAPADLFKGRPGRDAFLPFIALLKDQVEVVSVAGSHDYRLDRLRAAGTWFSPIDPDNRRTFSALWRDMLGTEAAEGESIEVMGRRLDFPDAAGGLVRAGFARLCDAALGPNDYLALAERFHTVFLEDLPRLTPDRREAARRFVTLIDALYEARTRLIVLAEADPVRLYPAGDGAFEFERTASRLQEMRSADWLADRS
jgi:cell division protein ZapE